MSLWSKIRGTYETIFQIGKGGPHLEGVSTTVVAAKDQPNTGYAQLRCLSPTVPGNTAADVPNMTYFKSARHVVKIAITTTADQYSAVALPNNSIITNCWIEIETPYSASATIAVDRKGDGTKLLQIAADNNPQAAGIYEVKQMTNWGSTGDGEVHVKIENTPVAGAATVYVECVGALTL